ncbi:MAG: DUF952 domain-containing protein [Akkermansiaceae bacterium]|nr:DUF952 domain-containing protein [Armatimonadota bacterium]
MEPIYHLTGRRDWEDAIANDRPYTLSTLGKTLDEVGFIHCSFAGQVARVANHFYRDQVGLVLLTIDPALLQSPVNVESVAGTDEKFPHIYGPLHRGAVVAVREFAPGPDGVFVFAP